MRIWFQSDTPRFFLILAMIAIVSFALAQCGEAQPLSPAEHCIPVYDDAVICVVDSYVIDAYGDMERASVAFNLLPEWQQRSGFVLTTNDPTRRALVVYAWDFALGPMPAPATDGYVAELFPRVADASARLGRLEHQERAQSFLLAVEYPWHDTLLVYRRFPTCGGGR